MSVGDHAQLTSYHVNCAEDIGKMDPLYVLIEKIRIVKYVHTLDPATSTRYPLLRNSHMHVHKDKSSGVPCSPVCNMIKRNDLASLVARWLRICLPMQGKRVRALVREDPTCCRATKPVRHNYCACALEPASHNY